MSATIAVSPWSGRLARTTVGLFSLTFLFAFEAIAVGTVMPQITDDLDGLSLYAVGFAAPTAASVVALAMAGPWVDARGPRIPIAVGVLTFVAGLLIAGLAPSMPVFLVGRFVHGLGAGLVGVAQYVVVAQAYPERLRARVFAILTTAWVLPALVGPALAAQTTHLVGWRWVFIGATVIALAAWLLVRHAPSTPGSGGTRGKLRWAVVAALGVLVVSAAGQGAVTGWWLLLALATVVVVLAGTRLLPAGSWTGRRGLPSVIGTRGLVQVAFLVTEVYVPLLLTLGRGLSIGAAGWALTVGAVTWSLGSWLAARVSRLADEVLRVRLGAALNALGVAGFGASAATGMPLVVPLVAWAVAGLGIGMAFATLAVLALAESPEGGEGSTSAAVQLNDALTLALALALGSAVFAGFADSAPVTGATILVLAAAALGVLALVPASRLRQPVSAPG